jgi:hypothetical protein
MAAKKSKSNIPLAPDVSERVSALDSPTPIAGILGPGRWLVVDYDPTALFSLKISMATSSVGKTLVVPTPYAIKMALIDAAFRWGYTEPDCEALLRSLIQVTVRIGPGPGAVVIHTFVKVRQESRDSDPLRPYSSTIAYREVAHHDGIWQWAFDLAAGDDTLAQRLVDLLPHVSYIGKRGSFIQFRGFSRRQELANDFTQPLQTATSWSPPPRAHIVPLDDFGPEADLETLSSFTTKRPIRGRHRLFIDTIVPIGIVNTGPGFTEYRRE